MKLRFIIYLLTVSITLSSALAQGINYNAVYRVDGKGGAQEETYRSHVNIESLNNDESAVLVENGAKLILTSVRLNKTGGHPSSPVWRELYGVNSALLANSGSNLLVETSTFNVHTSEADAITSQGAGTSVTVQGGQFNITRDRSTALRVTGGGFLKAEKVSVSTLGNKCPAVAACDDGSKAIVNEMKGSTNGVSSPLFFTSGELMATKCYMESGASQISTVEGNGSLTLDDCELIGANYCGFLVYSQDVREGEAHINITSCKLSSKGGAFFFVTNSDVSIHMQKNSIVRSGKVLLNACKDDWGIAGRNGGNVTLKADRQKLEGDVMVDSISSVRIILGKGSSLNGSVNSVGNPCAEARLYIAKGASWNPKESSYLTSLEFEEPVAKGIKRIRSRNDIFYKADDSSSSQLEGKEYRLSGGGMLKPL